MREVEFTAVPLLMLPHTALCDSETLTNRACFGESAAGATCEARAEKWRFAGESTKHEAPAGRGPPRSCVVGFARPPTSCCAPGNATRTLMPHLCQAGWQSQREACECEGETPVIA